jgi:hypothetical protein
MARRRLSFAGCFHLWLLVGSLPVGGLLFRSRDVAYAKGSAPLVEDPFDIAAGGASLTRASQGGMILSNPALIPYGPGFHRWVGSETTLIVGKDSVDFARSLQNGDSSASNDGSSDQSKFIEKIVTTPIHAGTLNNLSYINRLFGIGAFSRNEFDIAVKKFGDTGLPSVRFRGESYQALGLSAASFIAGPAISFGVTGKYLYASAPDLAIDLTDQEAIGRLQTTGGIRSLMAMNSGFGYDAGLLFFSQGLNVDYRLALKVDDIGGTSLGGDGTLTELRQVASAGLGYTLHNAVDAIHLSLDYRDIQASYQEELFKRIRIGAKLLVRRHLGLGIGYYDGWPSYGLEVDAWIIRLTATYYTREFGAKPGIDPRPLYALGFSMGF